MCVYIYTHIYLLLHFYRGLILPIRLIEDRTPEFYCFLKRVQSIPNQDLPFSNDTAIAVIERHSGNNNNNDTEISKEIDRWAARNGITRVPKHFHLGNAQLGVTKFTDFGGALVHFHIWAIELVLRGYRGPIYVLIPTLVSFTRHYEDWLTLNNFCRQASLPYDIQVITIDKSSSKFIRVDTIPQNFFKSDMNERIDHRKMLAIHHHERNRQMFIARGGVAEVYLILLLKFRIS